MKKALLILCIVSFPAIASASYLFENYSMNLNPLAAMTLLGIGLLASSRALRQVVKTK